MNKYAVIALIAILAAGAFIRLYPAAAWDRPLKYDAYYHIRVAEQVKQTGQLPSWDPWPYPGRPHVYPPAYHLLIAGASIASGIDVTDVTRFMLPLFTSITVLAAFFVASRFRKTETALLTAFFIALNPFLISASYDSPEGIGFFIIILAAYFFLKEKYWTAGILFAIPPLLSTFMLYTLVPFIAILLYERKFTPILKIVALPAALIIAWYGTRLDALSCVNNSFGPYFVGKAINYWVVFYAPLIIGFCLTCFSLMTTKMDRYRMLWLAWTIFFLAAFLTTFATDIAHPWRMPTFLAIGFAFLLADVVRASRHKWARLFALFFVIVFFMTSLVVSGNNSLRPPLFEFEHTGLGWMQANIGEETVLASYVISSNIHMYIGKNALLDLNFECIPDNQAWFDYENMYWTGDPAHAQHVLETYDVGYVVFGSQDWGRTKLNDFNVDKLYSSWMCYPSFCYQDFTVYKVNE